MLGGYAGKCLRINLSTGKSEITQHDPEVLRKYVGGTGIATKLLYEEVHQDVDALGEKNLLIFATGPLTGTSAPGSGNYTVASRSPLSGFFVASQANGHFGPALKKTGYDFIIFEGKSPDLVYLYIDNEGFHLLDAGWLRGQGTANTEKHLKEKHGKNARVACIGPAGENLVRFAAIVCDEGHVAASGGIGAVMGSKNVKALVVNGNKSILVADREKFTQYAKEWRQDAVNSGLGRSFNDYGSAANFAAYHKAGWVPVKNLTTNEFTKYEDFDGRNIRQRYEMRSSRCHACPIDHCKTLRITSGPHAGFNGEEPEYEDLAGWGPNIGNPDLDEAIIISSIVDDLGMDTKESTFNISLVLECYEKGLLDTERLDGIRAEWGNVEAVKKLLQKIATRSGVGNDLANGIISTAQWIGGDALSRAVYVKERYAPHVHDLRTRWGTLFTQSISNMGSQEGIDLTARNSPDIGVAEAVGLSTTRIPDAQTKSGPKRQLEDAMGVCYFLCRGNSGLDVFVKTLNSLTGWDITTDEALTIGTRIINLQRCFNIRHGHTAVNDSVSRRILEPPKDGPKKGQTMADTYAETKSNYYKYMGWDEKGCPLPETLKKLGLGFAAQEIAKQGIAKQGIGGQKI